MNIDITTVIDPPSPTSISLLSDIESNGENNSSSSGNDVGLSYFAAERNASQQLQQSISQQIPFLRSTRNRRPLERSNAVSYRHSSIVNSMENLPEGLGGTERSITLQQDAPESNLYSSTSPNAISRRLARF